MLPGRTIVRTFVSGCLISGAAVVGAVEIDDLSLGDLLDLQVTSVSRQSEPLFTAASAITVVDRQALEDRHVRSLPDALRGVPGLSVSQLNASQWEIGSRGFGFRFTNKMQVMIDGRSIYTPTFSGIYWDLHDLVIDDVAAIEVIRGPGSSLWGANAVSGVVNVTTQHAAESRGLMVFGGIGSLRREGVVRYGWQLGEGIHARFTAKALGVDDHEAVNGHALANDAWVGSSLRGRLDWQVLPDQAIELHVGVQENRTDELALQPLHEPPYVDEIPFEDGYGNSWFATGHWRAGDPQLGEWRVSASVDGYRRAYADGFVDRRTNTAIECGYARHWSKLIDVNVGLQFHHSVSDYDHGSVTTFTDASRSTGLVGGYVQNRASFWDERLVVTLGAKLEDHDDVGFEVLPSAKVAWRVCDDHVLWGSVSRAIRRPAEFEMTSLIWDRTEPADGGLDLVGYVAGDSAAEFEVMHSLELGWRWRPGDRLRLDTAAFVFDYEDLASFALPEPADLDFQPPNDLIFVGQIENRVNGEYVGWETSIEWEATDRLALTLNYSYITMATESQAGERVLFDYRRAPRHMIDILGDWDLTRQWRLAWQATWVDAITRSSNPAWTTDDHLRLHCFVTYRSAEDWEAGLSLKHLAEAEQAEVVNDFLAAPSAIPTSAFIWFRGRF